jgi:uracil phosphoribosyltransferase
MQKIIADFLKVNRQLLIDMGISENANLLHGKEYSLHISQKIGAKIDTALVKEKLGELEYHKCKVPTQYKTIQAMAIDDKRVAIDSGRYSTRELSDFQLAV